MIAWVLNLDADLELARPSRYSPSRAAIEANTVFRPNALKLLGPDDVVIDEGGRLSKETRGVPGRAFCPTPRALRMLAIAGAVPEAAPSLEVLRAVNSRAFACPVNEPDAFGSRFVTDAESAIHVLSVPSPSGRWLAKRAFGFAGKGQRRVGANPTTADRAWIAASMRLGGLQIEPWVETTIEVAIHGSIDGEVVRRGQPCVQQCDAFGAWQSTRLATVDELDPGESRALHDAFDETADALRRAGYFGPFGIDAFRWRDGRGALRFRARSEVNARYTMGYAVGMSAQRT